MKVLKSKRNLSRIDIRAQARVVKRDMQIYKNKVINKVEMVKTIQRD